ncbi:hypothetical protein P691DRAFT_779193 [Macrolepiota fuliginosa MF-IS2]|uniref:Fe2OG dioxygenase domain-containing protein n=1 Tax=Macrolepiota fuliginosa MF-IS2 TaxID=1400762 RepID=A0A9P6BXA2_9AGAR|nr:hypothetical protein P691DRAFT_779193 [Macrolepiota fuliginosa MF-IS2]
MATNTVEHLRSALIHKQSLHRPWTSGIISLSDPEKTLYFTRKDGTPGSLQLGSATQMQAADLSRACEPAIFGHGQENILDESHCKIGGFDGGEFSWVFNPDRGEFMSKIVTGLFPWNTLDRGIRFEMPTLNVYEEGSFLKPHQDNSHNEDMLGSLVFVLPLEHEGGSLFLRSRGQEFSYDGASLLKNSPPGSVAYIAFFGDVEHEVAEVTSGRRVTITFNIYFDSNRGPPVTKVAPELQAEHPFKTVLKNCLTDEKFRNDHPSIGFGLAHTYPFKTAISKPGKLQLKGSDAILVQTLAGLGVPFNYYLVYCDPDALFFDRECPFRILSRGIVDGCMDIESEEDAWAEITKGESSYFVWNKNPGATLKRGEQTDWYSRWYKEKNRYRSISVDWITDLNEEDLDGLDRSVFVHREDASLQYFHHQLCILLKVVPTDVCSSTRGEDDGSGGM